MKWHSFRLTGETKTGDTVWDVVALAEVVECSGFPLYRETLRQLYRSKPYGAWRRLDNGDWYHNHEMLELEGAAKVRAAVAATQDQRAG